MQLSKIAIAVMLLATTALSTPNVTVTATTDMPTAAGTVDVSFWGSSDIAIGAISIYANASKQRAVRVTALTAPLPELPFDPGIIPTIAIEIPSGDPSDFANYSGNYGVMSPLASGATITTPTVFIVMTLTITPGTNISTQDPLVLTFLGDWASSLNTGAQSDLWRPVTVTITPEPASMLLLAAGAAFFARRRRA